MNAEEIADVAWRLLKTRPCPKCDGKIELTVKIRRGVRSTSFNKPTVTESTFSLLCKECGVFVATVSHVELNNRISIRAQAEAAYEALATSARNFHKEVAERLMKSV